MKYNEEFFYGEYGKIKKDNFHITESDIEKVKSLKSYIDKSSYYDTMLMWRLKDNPQIKDIEELSRLFVVMQFIAMLADIDPKLQELHNIKKHHIGLLRRLYLEFDDYSHDSAFITMGYKRPFGNSNVLSDVKEEMDRYNGKHPMYDEKDDENYKYDKEEKVLVEFVNFLSDFYKGGFNLEWRNFVYENQIFKKNKSTRIEWEKILLYREFRLHSYLRDWTLDPSEIRDKKIEILLK